MYSASTGSVVCGQPISECLDKIQKFHGHHAPGVVLGLFMVDMAQERVGKGVETDAIVETRHCLPDAVQLFTPCTIGNGWLKILDWDKYALCLYDRKNRCGWRVWLDMEKAAAFPKLYGWYTHRIPKKDLPLTVLLESILAAGRSVLEYKPVNVFRFHHRIKKGGTSICPDCGESFSTRQGQTCASCQGQVYWRALSADRPGEPETPVCRSGFSKPDP